MLGDIKNVRRGCPVFRRRVFNNKIIFVFAPENPDSVVKVDYIIAQPKFNFITPLAPLILRGASEFALPLKVRGIEGVISIM